jgi:hypothetical protein
MSYKLGSDSSNSVTILKFNIYIYTESKNTTQVWEKLLLCQPAPGCIYTQETIAVVCISTAQSRQTATSWL